ncbi:unnamed protein product [Cylicocyclus nassatus]|uniref:Potassium channel domain-containing protein n=1 Tax=Cylicocyclus nassatus TaxID=53992 RepID=A0AA36HB34_CYLNA|nr:unnamed protein product [Cylicocyclus nassatus]
MWRRTLIARRIVEELGQTQLLVESLKRYEDRLDLKTPDRREWTFLNSFNYAYSLLLTLGHGYKIPETTGGQIFALIYSLLGVPLFFGTLAITLYQCAIPLLTSKVCTLNRRFFCLQLILIVYIAWSILLAVFLYYQVHKDFWASVFTAFLSGMTIQVPYAHRIGSSCFLMLLLGSTVSAAIIILGIIVAVAAYCPQTTGSIQVKKSAVADDGAQQPQKFTVIVDQAGESKLAMDE